MQPSFENFGYQSALKSSPCEDSEELLVALQDAFPTQLYPVVFHSKMINVKTPANFNDTKVRMPFPSLLTHANCNLLGQKYAQHQQDFATGLLRYPCMVCCVKQFKKHVIRGNFNSPTVKV